MRGGATRQCVIRPLSPPASQVDRQHAELRDRERGDQLVSVAASLFERSEPVRGLRRAALLSDVLAEREAQRALRRRQAEQARRADADFVTRQRAATQVWPRRALSH